MDEKNGSVFEDSGAFTEDGGISFGGGADNAYIKEYAASPKRERTIEDIEKEELIVAEKQAEIQERNARRREEAEGKRPKGFYPAQNREAPEQKKPAEEAARPKVYPSEHSNADAMPKKKLTRADLVIPLSDDADFVPEPDEKPSEEKKQLSRFKRIFSESNGFSAFSIITGVSLIIWNVLYMITAVMRDNLFTSAVNTMLSQGQISFTVEFNSPALTVLKVMVYILPVLILGWLISFRASDKKNIFYNKKTIIIIMCLIMLAAVTAVFDVSYAHLVMV